MRAHLITIVTSKSKVCTMDGKPATVWRWSCSCYRTGPEQLEARRARNGGARHVAAQERSR